jgi:hypothetical protein
MSRDIYGAADALQYARDHLVIAKTDKVNRDHHVRCAIENLREAMRILGVKEAENDGNNS